MILKFQKLKYSLWDTLMCYALTITVLLATNEYNNYSGTLSKDCRIPAMAGKHMLTMQGEKPHGGDRPPMESSILLQDRFLFHLATG